MGPQQTPSQTVGPFFRHALIKPGQETLVRPETRGERILIEGRVLDGDGAPVPDAMVEIWQANAEGRYDHPEDDQEKLLDPNFHGYGRSPTDAEGWFHFRTIKPGAVPGRDNVLQAPHIEVSVFARGLLKRLVTRIYFPGEPLNPSDSLLKAVPEKRRSTLVARPVKDGPERVLRFDVVLQGENETVFLDI